MTILDTWTVSEIFLLTKRPWIYKPIDIWKAAKRFEADFNCSFTSHAKNHWLGKRTTEIDATTLHDDWTFHAEPLRNGSLRIFILPKSNYFEFLDDARDGLIKDRFP